MLGLKLFCHVYSRKYSRLCVLDAMLTLGRLYSLFSQSPVEKGYSILFLGRLPTSLSSIGENMDISYSVVGLSQTKRASKKSRSNDLLFCWLPLLG